MLTKENNEDLIRKKATKYKNVISKYSDSDSCYQLKLVNDMKFNNYLCKLPTISMK